jgi:hypothetical protein
MKPSEERAAAWAQTRSDIRAALMVGSRAHLDHPGDEWADLDLMLFAADFSDYFANTNLLCVRQGI